MAKFCKKCGTPIPEGSMFCPKCGIKLEQAPAAQPSPPPPPQQPPAQTQPTPPPQPKQPGYQQQQPYQQKPMGYQQPYYSQTQPYAPIQQKSKKPLIIGIILIVVIFIIVALILVFFVFGGNGHDERFVGEWEPQGYYGDTLKFKDDGTMTMSSDPETTVEWKTKGDDLCLQAVGAANEYCMKFTFSDNDNTLKLDNYLNQGISVTFKKK